jgi:aminoglycoside 6'-N-acetyltransferase I
MNKDILKEILTGQLDKEPIPYELLLDADPSMEAIERYLPFSEIHVATLKDKVIGTIVLYPLNANELEIKNIAVEESLQGNGIGGLMLKYATEIAIAKRAKILVIGTANSSVAQLYLYQRNGFEITGIKQNFFLDNYPEPIFENDIQCKHLIMLSKQL